MRDHTQMRDPARLAVKLAIACLLALTLSVSLAAQTAPEKLFLWEATGANGKAYLLGSIHLAREELYPLDPAIEKAFAESETLVVEVDLEKEQAGMQKRMLTAGVYPTGQTLETQLPAVTVTRLKNFFAARGLPFSVVKVMRPWLAAVMLTATELRRLGFNLELGIDQHFLDQAKKTDKPIRALESADFQIQLLSGFSDDVQEMFLVYTLNDAEKIPDMIDQLMTAWKQGDTETIRKLVVEPSDRDERLAPVYEKMFDERNIAMAKKIGDLLDGGGTWFVVVGAGHFVGETGIVPLLTEDPRFEVRQVSSTVVAAP